MSLHIAASSQQQSSSHQRTHNSRLDLSAPNGNVQDRPLASWCGLRHDSMTSRMTPPTCRLFTSDTDTCTSTSTDEKRHRHLRNLRTPNRSATSPLQPLTTLADETATYKLAEQRVLACQPSRAAQPFKVSKINSSPKSYHTTPRNACRNQPPTRRSFKVYETQATCVLLLIRLFQQRPVPVSHTHVFFGCMPSVNGGPQITQMN